MEVKNKTLKSLTIFHVPKPQLFGSHKDANKAIRKTNQHQTIRIFFRKFDRNSSLSFKNFIRIHSVKKLHNKLSQVKTFHDINANCLNTIDSFYRVIPDLLLRNLQWDNFVNNTDDISHIARCIMNSRIVSQFTLFLTINTKVLHFQHWWLKWDLLPY